MDDILRAFQILGIEPGASSKTAKKAYRDLVKKWHPDKFANDARQREAAEEKLKEINLAFERVQTYRPPPAIASPRPASKRASTHRASRPRTSQVPPKPKEASTSAPPGSQRTSPESTGPANHAKGNASEQRRFWPRHLGGRIALAAAIAAGIMVFVLTILPRRTYNGATSEPPTQDQTRVTASSPGNPSAVSRDSNQLQSPRDQAVQDLLEILRSDLQGSPTDQSKIFQEHVQPTSRPADTFEPSEHISLSRATTTLKSKLIEQPGAPATVIAASTSEDPESQFRLGVRYATGDGVAQDYAEAIKCYRAAAEAGHSESQKNLGLLYASGKGVPQDLAEADKWLALAASRGNAGASLAKAAVALVKSEAERTAAREDHSKTDEPADDPQAHFSRGQRYLHGEGVAQNFPAAIKSLRLAAEAGHMEAQKTIGFLYGSGKGVTQDNAEAQKWFRKAAAQGSVSADFAKAVVSLSDLEERRSQKAANDSGKASDAETPEIQFQRGLRYYEGDGVQKDYIQAAHWYRRAAESGHARAQRNLGFLYAAGKGVPQDDTEAQKWLSKAAAQGNEGASFANAIVALAKTEKQRETIHSSKEAMGPVATNPASLKIQLNP